ASASSGLRRPTARKGRSPSRKAPAGRPTRWSRQRRRLRALRVADHEGHGRRVPGHEGLAGCRPGGRHDAAALGHRRAD
ncbi:hypothetical protein M885DRAFT_625132, partial [Pelagophyceae sp. CCMP2097]